jgi:hypothetical protein
MDITGSPACIVAADAADGGDQTPHLSTFSIFHKFQCALATYVQTMEVRDKRYVFAKMRDLPDVQPSSFLPKYGVTVGEFTTMTVLTPVARKSSSSTTSAPSEVRPSPGK